MDLSLVEVQLKTDLSGLVRQVGVSADLDAAMRGTVTTPAAFVIPLTEVGKDDGLLSNTSQSISQTFGVVQVVSNRRDVRGGAALDELKTFRAALKNTLIGWVPDADTGEPVVFSRGKLLKFDTDGRLWWIDEFRINSYWSA